MKKLLRLLANSDGMAALQVSKQTALLEREISDLRAKANHLGEKIDALGSVHF